MQGGDGASDGPDCQRCGRCCTFIGNVFQIASPEEWERIIAYILETRGGRWVIKCRCSPGCNHVWEGTVRGMEDLPTFFLEDVYPCPFLARERDGRGRFTGRTSCTIYPVRPAICRLYPFSQADADLYGCPVRSTEARSRSAMPARVPTRAPRMLKARSQ